jgi:Tol biopolymer transport system component
MGATRLRRGQLLFISALVALSPSLAGAGGVGVSTPPETPQQQQQAPPSFNPYKVPATTSPRAFRDLEFLWSNNFRASFSRPLDSLYAGATESDLDRFGKTICDELATNPFGFDYSDIQLIFDYLNRRPIADRESLYNFDPSARFGFKVSPAHPDTDRKHVDAYIYVPNFQNDPGFGSYAGDVSDNHGESPSAFVDPKEDLSTGHSSGDVLHDNSFMIPGPTPSQVGDQNNSTRWNRSDIRASWAFNHEVQHAMNFRDPLSVMNEVFSSAAEALAGEMADRPRFDVPYTWNLLRWNASLELHNYAMWRSLTAYLSFNFRGVDLSSGGRTDDLMWRWSMGPTRNLTDLARRLSPEECAECATKTYFNGLSPTDRFHLLLHNWRVANFVNKVALADSQYGFVQPAQLGFDPRHDLLCWQSVDQNTSNDSLNIFLQLTASAANITREISKAGHAAPLPNAHVLALERFGADYWVIRSDPSLWSANRDLVVRVVPEGICQSRIMVTAIAYNEQNLASGEPDSLWKHPEWAQTAIGPVIRDLDQTGGGDERAEVVIPNFGQSNKAVLVVITLSNSNFDYATATKVLPYRLNVSLRTGSYQTPNPMAVYTGTTFDAFPTWSPVGDEIAFMRGAPPGGVSQIYRGKLDGSPGSVLIPQPYDQFRPDWSPRGDWIAFDQDTPGGQCDVFIFNPSTAQLRQLSSTSEHEFDPVFSPNGQQLAYSRNSSPGEIHRVNLDGTNDTVLVRRPTPQTLRWSPDGRWIYFLAVDSLYAVGATGANRGVVLDKSALLRAQFYDLPLGTERILAATTWNPSSCDDGIPGPTVRRLVAIDTTQLVHEALFYRSRASFEGPRWSFDNTRVAYASDQNGTKDVFVGQVGFNHAPIFTNVGDTEITAVPFSFTLNATDTDGEPITYKSAYLPPGATLSASGLFTWPEPGPLGSEHYIVFRALDPSGGVANRVVKYTVGTGGGGGCPVVESRTAESWRYENTILGRSRDGNLAEDTYRLRHSLSAGDSRYEVRVLENEQEETTLDQARLLAVDYDPDLEAFATTHGIALGRRRPAHRVTTHTGQDVTHLVSGDAKFRGRPGDMLLVEMLAPGESWSPAGGDLRYRRGLLADDEKMGPSPGSLRPQGASPAAIDAAVLDQSGILVQVPDGEGGWRTVQHRYPREKLDETLIESAESSKLRLVFVGQHSIGFIGHIVHAGWAEPVEQRLRVARHSRLRDVHEAISRAGAGITMLVPGDTVTMAFEATAVPAGKKRDLFLVTRGVYTAKSGGSGQVSGGPLPARFSLAQNLPNPFARTTTIRFELPRSEQVKLEVYDLFGRRIGTLATGEYGAGYHAVEWDRRDRTGSPVPGGVYVYSLTAGSFRDQKKMVLLP